ncbi:MAG: hypothetical protein ACR2NN_11570 [Bryobacteraceae bacterium]
MPRVKRKRRKNQHVALAFATLLSPIKLTAFVLGCWRLAADLGMARGFAISNGFFSHWQVWIGIAAIVQIMKVAMNRYGNAKPALQESEQKGREAILHSGF